MFTMNSYSGGDCFCARVKAGRGGTGAVVNVSWPFCILGSRATKDCFGVAILIGFSTLFVCSGCV